MVITLTEPLYEPLKEPYLAWALPIRLCDRKLYSSSAMRHTEPQTQSSQRKPAKTPENPEC